MAGAKDRTYEEVASSSGEAVDVIEIAGSIKWFDVSKGFGFIVPDGDMPDVLLHVTCLRRDGFQTVLEGSRIVCEVVKRERGYQAFRILSLDESTAVHPSQKEGGKTHFDVKAESELERVQVKWFNRTKGFGFIVRESGEEIFVHQRSILSEGSGDNRRRPALKDGQNVTFVVANREKGLQAEDVSPA